MEVVTLGAGADIFGGMGGGDPGPPGPPGGPGTEETPGESGPGDPNPDQNTNPEIASLPQVPREALQLPPNQAPRETTDEVSQVLEKVAADASAEKKPLTKPGGVGKTGAATKPGGTKGMGKDTGGGGSGGKDKRPGPGGGPPGGKATEQEAKAFRWRFDMTGSPKEHADKLDRAGVMIAVPDPAAGKADPRSGPYLFITDLKRRPVQFDRKDLSQFAGAVKWYNNRPESVQGLAQELKLPFVPPFVVLLLPKDREARMAAEEKRYADDHRRKLDTIQETWFDFRLQNGGYEPVVTKQH